MFSVLTFGFVLVLRWEGGNVGARVHAMFIKSYVLFVSLVTRLDRSRFPWLIITNMTRRSANVLM